ncbi:PH domain-containing protein [Streptomyces sp. DW26H14]|uniref:PH domain-containing protein n=1 Tax=Streptomyces sp. DW26H14 TaxID=3435395 RepID=UPI00403E0F2F
MTASSDSASLSKADRVYRSAGGIIGGTLLLALVLWVGGSLLAAADERGWWRTLAGLFLAVPVISGLTVRPAVFAGPDRLRIRNPFRTITLPWEAVEVVRGGTGSMVRTHGGVKYRPWALTISMGKRMRANAGGAVLNHSAYGASSAHMYAAASNSDPAVAEFDQAITYMRALAEQAGTRPATGARAVVRPAYGVIAPALLGALTLAVLQVVG